MRLKRKSNPTEEPQAKRPEVEEQPCELDTLFFSLLNDSEINYEWQESKLSKIQTKDLSIFQNKIKGCLNSQEKCSSFMKSVRVLAENRDNFRTFLSPIWISDKPSDQENGHYGDSICKVSLDVELLQMNLVEFLFEQIPVYSDENDNDSFSDNCTINLIISQLRWTDFHNNITAIIDLIFQYLGILPLIIQRQLLSLLSEFINDETMSKSIQSLTELITGEPNLTVYVIDLLSDLDLTADQIVLIRSTLLQLINKVNISQNSIILKFSLQYLDIEQLNGIFNKYRNYITADIIQQDFNSFHIFFNTISSLLKCKIDITTKIFKIIKKVTVENISIFDIWLLFICLSIMSISPKAESIFRKLCENEIISSQLIEDSLNNYQLLFQPYFTVLLHLASHLVNKNEPIFIDRGITIYYILFKYFENPSDKQKVILGIISHINGFTPNTTNKCLLLLYKYTEPELINSFQYYGLYVRSLLDIIYTLNKEDHKIISKILTKLCCLSNDTPGFSFDELLIYIQKHLSNTSELYQQIGVIFSLSVIDVLSQIQNYNGKTSLENCEEIFNLCYSICKRDTKLKSFFYNELSNYIENGKYDIHFIEIIFNLVSQEFDNLFISEIPESGIYEELKDYDDIIPKPIYNISNNNNNNNKVINILLLLLNQNKYIINLFIPEFKLLVLCNEIIHKNIINLLPYLSYPLLVVSVDTLNNISTYKSETIELLKQCYIYSLQWLRLLISIFSNIDGNEIIRMCYLRCENITEVEETIKKKFKTIEKDKGKAKSPNSKTKSLSSSLIQSNNSSSISDTQIVTFHPHSLILLKCKIIKSQSLENNTIQLYQLDSQSILYLLSENYPTIKSVLDPPKGFFTKMKQMHEISANNNNYTPQEIISYLSLDVLVSFRNQISLRIIEKNITSSEDDSNNSEYDDSIIEYIGKIFVVLLHSEYVESNKDYHKLVLSILGKCEDESNDKNKSEILKLSFEYIQSILEHITNFNIINIFIDLLKKIVDIIESTDDELYTTKRQAYNLLLSSFLQKNWNISNYKAKNIGLLLKYYFLQTPIQFDLTMNFVGTTFRELMDEDNKAINYSENYPTLNKTTLPLYYSTLIEVTQQSFSLVEFDIDEVINTLRIIAQHIVTFTTLIHFTSYVQTRPILTSALKYGSKFIDIFLSKVIPFISKIFKNYINEVTDILKTFQKGTRQIQALCSHGKSTRNTSMISIAPKIKKNLELFIYKIKAITQENDCPNVFWVGNLKNKDLNGKVINDEIEESDGD